jgi:L-aspartate oxidase
VGIIRDGKDLCETVERLQSIPFPGVAAPSRPYYEARNIFEVAQLIARSALARKESRGTHYRADFPFKNDSTPPQHSLISKGSSVRFE